MKKIFGALLLLGILKLYLLYTSRYSFSDFAPKNQKKRYLIETPKCRILDVSPFDPQVMPHFKREFYKFCGPFGLLTYVTVENKTATLHINETVARRHRRSFRCLYQNLAEIEFMYYKLQNYLEHPAFMPFIPFERNVTFDFDFVAVICLRAKKVFYANVHAPIVLKENITERQKLMKNRDQAFSVLIVGIESMSRLNFLRTLPKTHLLLEENNWISLKGYSKIADNTLPNLLALLAGLDDPKTFENCANCSLLFSEFGQVGYATAYAEDEPSLVGNQQIFEKFPTDYNFHPYFRINENLKNRKRHGLNYCTGPENSGERVLNLAKNFAQTFKNRPSFGLFWMKSFSHNNLNLASSMDSKIRDFFVNITNSGILKNTFVFFLSDHGLRFGSFRETAMGWLEERLPFVYIWVPVIFRVNFRKQYHSLEDNSDKLTTPYHLYMTLQDILVLSKQNYGIKASQACPNCRSLFESFEDRTCEEAGIDYHWCACNDYIALNTEANFVTILSEYVLRYIHTMIFDQGGEKKCLRYSITRIISVSISDNHKNILLIFETSPKAVFEVTVLYTPGRGQTYSVKGGISRLDNYGEHSDCTSNRLLRKLCYCR